ncbi:MAG: hypothetical protein ACKVS9_19440, partial [Phycisphaerae bacterium]
MTLTAFQTTDDFLHARGVYQPARARERRWQTLTLMVVAFGAVYGGAMGTFVVDSPDRLWQLLFGAIKVPMLLLATTLLCLP